MKITVFSIHKLSSFLLSHSLRIVSKSWPFLGNVFASRCAGREPLLERLLIHFLKMGCSQQFLNFTVLCGSGSIPRFSFKRNLFVGTGFWCSKKKHDYQYSSGCLFWAFMAKYFFPFSFDIFYHSEILASIHVKFVLFVTPSALPTDFSHDS